MSLAHALRWFRVWGLQSDTISAILDEEAR